MKPLIKKMKLAHVNEIYEIEKQCFVTPWSSTTFVHYAASPYSISIVAIIDNKVAGYICCQNIAGDGHIDNVATAPAHQGRGIGSIMMERLINNAARLGFSGLTLEVASRNAAAIALYTKHGFAPEGLRKNYYADTQDDAIIMWKYFI